LDASGQSESDAVAAYKASIVARVRLAVGDRGWREVARDTGYNRETVRRYCTKGGFDGDWLMRVAAAYGVNGHWLLTGDGPMRACEIVTDALKAARVGALAEALGDRLDRLASGAGERAAPATGRLDGSTRGTNQVM
jgi:hypothetical protein